MGSCKFSLFLTVAAYLCAELSPRSLIYNLCDGADVPFQFLLFAKLTRLLWNRLEPLSTVVAKELKNCVKWNEIKMNKWRNVCWRFWVLVRTRNFLKGGGVACMQIFPNGIRADMINACGSFWTHFVNQLLIVYYCDLCRWMYGDVVEKTGKVYKGW